MNKGQQLNKAETIKYTEPFINLISEKFNDFPPGQRRIAQSILKRPEILSCVSLVEFTEKTNSSQATIIRFCRTLGFSGFHQFIREVQQALQVHLSIHDRFIMSDNSYKEEDLSSLQRVVQSAIEGLTVFQESIVDTEFVSVVEKMIMADNIFILGSLGSYPLALHFAQQLSKICNKVTLFEHQTINSITGLNKITSDSLVFSIAYPRYPSSTINMARQASQYGATIISITNSKLCPTVPFSAHTLITPLSLLSYVDLFTAPITLITALITAYAHRTNEESKRLLLNFDIYTEDHGVFTG